MSDHRETAEELRVRLAKDSAEQPVLSAADLSRVSRERHTQGGEVRARIDVHALLDENARLRAALDAVKAVCDSAPPAQGLTGIYEGTVLPSQIEKAIAAALGEVVA